jgi:hypothetical protein
MSKHKKEISIKSCFRWIFQLDDIPEHFVKRVKLPQKKYSCQGGWNWGELCVDFHDVSNDNEALWEYILGNASKCEGKLTYFDGCGKELDKLVFKLRSKSIKFSNLDYSLNDKSLIRLKFDVIAVNQLKKLCFTS